MVSHWQSLTWCTSHWHMPFYLPPSCCPSAVLAAVHTAADSSKVVRCGSAHVQLEGGLEFYISLNRTLNRHCLQTLHVQHTTRLACKATVLFMPHVVHKLCRGVQTTGRPVAISVHPCANATSFRVLRSSKSC
jgi:hypothetical protein